MNREPTKRFVVNNMPMFELLADESQCDRLQRLHEYVDLIEDALDWFGEVGWSLVSIDQIRHFRGDPSRSSNDLPMDNRTKAMVYMGIDPAALEIERSTLLKQIQAEANK